MPTDPTTMFTALAFLIAGVLWLIALIVQYHFKDRQPTETKTLEQILDEEMRAAMNRTLDKLFAPTK